MKASVHVARLAQSKTRTRPLQSVIALGLSASLLIGNAGAARADDVATANAASSDERKSQAKAKYEQGVEAFRNEHYADAVRLFLEADALSPSAALSFNVARAYENLADDAATLRWYRNYLRLSPQAGNAHDVEQSIATLSAALAQKGIQQLTVLSTPVGATVTIDEQAIGVSPLTVELRPGAHRLLLTLRGFADAARSFTLEALTPLDISVDLEAAPSAAPPSVATDVRAPPRPAPDGARRPLGLAPWITLGAGAVFLGGAALFEVRRRSAEDAALGDQTQLATQQDLNARDSRQTTARVCLGVGGLLVAIGTVLVVLDRPITPQSRATIAAVPGGATLGLDGSF